MECRHLSSWTEFKSTLDELEREWASLKAKHGELVSPLLFRGQADARWHLTTTLERYLVPALSVLKYYNSVRAIRSQVETFTGRTWTMDKLTDIQADLKSRLFYPGLLPSLDFLVYLRHLGFPSPLLDWTKSPFVAAHFAFERPNLTPERVAVYAYLKFVGLAKSTWQDPPMVDGVVPYIRSHPRHFLQQSEYTVCTERRDGVLYFSSHEAALSGSDLSQGLLWKITIPSSESSTARSELDQFNITAYSLFGSVESLVETLAVQELWRAG